MVPAPTTSRRPWARPSGTEEVTRSRLVRPSDRHAGGAIGQLLARLGVAHDRREITLQLEAAEHDSLGGIELFLSHLLPARVGAGDDELGLLGVLPGPDANVTRLPVPEVEKNAAILGEVLVGFGEHHESDGALPTRCRLLVHRRLVDLGLEGLGPFWAVCVDHLGVCHVLPPWTGSPAPPGQP